MVAEGSVTDAVRGTEEKKWFASEMGTYMLLVSQIIGLIRALLPAEPHIPSSWFICQRHW